MQEVDLNIRNTAVKQNLSSRDFELLLLNILSAS